MNEEAKPFKFKLIMIAEKFLITNEGSVKMHLPGQGLSLPGESLSSFLKSAKSAFLGLKHPDIESNRIEST